jgi:hypothetical protein
MSLQVGLWGPEECEQWAEETLTSLHGQMMLGRCSHWKKNYRLTILQVLGLPVYQELCPPQQHQYPRWVLLQATSLIHHQVQTEYLN